MIRSPAVLWPSVYTRLNCVLFLSPRGVIGYDLSRAALDRQALPALGSPAPQHHAAVLGAHPFPEAVSPLPPRVMRLVCAFHLPVPSLMCVNLSCARGQLPRIMLTYKQFTIEKHGNLVKTIVLPPGNPLRGGAFPPPRPAPDYRFCAPLSIPGSNHASIPYITMYCEIFPPSPRIFLLSARGL